MKLSHELSSPITAITVNLELLKTKKNVDVEKRLNALQRSADVLLAIAADLNDLSKVVLGKFRLQPTKTCISSVLSSVYQFARPQVEAKGIKLLLDISEDGSISVDETKIHQALMNLTLNAIRFTPSGGTIHLKGSCNGHAEFTVTDDGSGIDPNLFPTLFNWPSIEKPEVAGKAGLGLGLPISREIAEMHGGEILAYNNPDGKGATFTIRIPRKLRPD